jgi:hypothetical protein
MNHDNKRTVFIMVVLLSLILQVVFVLADMQDTPGKAAVAFARMYYQLDSAMASRLCDELAQDEEKDVVVSYIQRAAAQAKELGYETDYMKKTLFDVKTHTIKSNSNSAEIRITANVKKGINPLFAYVGKLFCIGKTATLDQTVHLIKEGGKWKVCEGFFSVSEG